MSNTLAIEVDGTLYTGWKRAAIDFSMDSLVPAFSFLADDNNGVLSSLTTDTPCRIKVAPVGSSKQTLVLNGYITERDTVISETDHAVTVSGNAKTIDLVDCPTTVPQRSWVQAKFSKIIKDIASPFDINVNTDELINDPVIKKLTLQTGESAFDAIERLCRSQAVLPVTSYNGDLKLTYTADVFTRADVMLRLGYNITQLQERIDYSERYSEYIGLTQNSGGGKRWTKEVVQNQAKAFDRNITRYRPLVFVAESKMDAQSLAKRVNWEAQIRAGRSLEYTCQVVGWNQDPSVSSSPLWRCNQRVGLIADELNVDRELIISSVSFTLDDSGEITVLTLRDPDTYKQNPTEEIR